MFYLLLSILCSSLVQVIMRLSTNRVKNNLSMLTSCYLVCSLIAAYYTGFGNLICAGTAGFGRSVGLGFIQGMMYLGAFILLQINVKHNGVVLSASFMKLGLLVPMGVSILFFGEQPGIFHVIGFLVSLIAIVLINYEPGHGANASFKAGLILLLVVGGMGDVMAKIYQEVGNPDLSPQFLFYTFGTALILCLVLTLWKKPFPGKWEWLFGVLIGVPNFYSCRFLLMSLSSVPGVIAYPVYAVAGILLVTLSGVVLFREKLTRRQWVALAVIMGALILLNI